MDIANLQLHDGILLKVELDPTARIVEVRVAYYRDEVSSQRAEGVLRFSGVSQFNQLIDLELMERHADFGNISQWIFEERPGVSHIELARGLISITANSVELVADA